jgi:hypothetical protein
MSAYICVFRSHSRLIRWSVQGWRRSAGCLWEQTARWVQIQYGTYVGAYRTVPVPVPQFPGIYVLCACMLFISVFQRIGGVCVCACACCKQVLYLNTAFFYLFLLGFCIINWRCFYETRIHLCAPFKYSSGQSLFPFVCWNTHAHCHGLHFCVVRKIYCLILVMTLASNLRACLDSHV